MPLKSSITLLENIYSTGVTHDNWYMFIVQDKVKSLVYNNFALYIDISALSWTQMCQLHLRPYRTAHILHQCSKTTVLRCHRCLINTGVEKMNKI